MKISQTPKTVMITGVSRGLGRALALELARRGHTIIGCARTQDKLQALQAEISSQDPNASSSSVSLSSSKHLFHALDVVSDF